MYKTRACEFDDTKASVLGDYVPAKLSFEPDEKVIVMVVTKDYSGSMLFFFDTGRVSKVPLSAYETKTKRKKLSKAYCDKFKLLDAIFIQEDKEYVLTSTARRKLLFNSAMVTTKATRDTQGLQVMTVKKNHFVESVMEFDENTLANAHRFRAKGIPSTGAMIRLEDEGEQLKL